MPKFHAAIALGALIIAAGARAQTPERALAVPPAGAMRWSIVSGAAVPHGQTIAWTDGSGVHWSRESINMRGFLTETDQQVLLAPDGTLRSLLVRGSTPTGDAAETFALDGENASWRSPVDHGASAHAKAKLYVPFGGTFDANRWLVEALLAAPDRKLALLPAGEARLEPLATATVGAGPTKKDLIAYELLGVSTSPFPVWADAQGHFFGAVGQLSWVPAGYENDVAMLQKIESDAEAKRSPKVLADLLQPASGPVAFTHVEMFDAEAKRFVPDMTVVVEGGKIVRVGPAANTPAPGGGHDHPGRGQDPGSRPVGHAPALWRRLQRSLSSILGRHLGARSGQ